MAPRTDRGRARWRTASLVGVSLLAGIAIGGLAMRQRYKAREKEVIAAVNGVTLTKDEFYRRLERAAGPQTIRQMVAEELELQYARKQGRFPTDAQVDARYRQLRKQPEFAEQVARADMDANEYRRRLRVELAQANILSSGVQVSDADVRKYYETNIDPKNPLARYYTPETARIAVIITQTEQEARRALQALNEGIPFATVAQNYSKDNSRNAGGVLPDVQRGRTRSKQVPRLDDAVFGLKIGDQLGPSKFAGVWWIIRCLDRKQASTRPFESVKDECRLGAMLVKGLPANGKQVESGFQEFQRKANIQAFWEKYKNAITVQ